MYALEIIESGVVTFVGRMHVDSVGQFTTRIQPGQVDRLIRVLQEAGYFSLADRYVWREPACGPYAADAPTVTTSITIGSRVKRIEHDYGCAGTPATLAGVERQIDEIAESWRWIGRR